MMFMRCMLEFVLEKKSGGNFVEYWLNLFKSMKIIVLVEVVVFGKKRKFEWLKQENKFCNLLKVRLKFCDVFVNFIKIFN